MLYYRFLLCKGYLRAGLAFTKTGQVPGKVHRRHGSMGGIIPWWVKIKQMQEIRFIKNEMVKHPST